MTLKSKTPVDWWLGKELKSATETFNFKYIMEKV